MFNIIKFFIVLQGQAIAAIPLAHWLHSRCTPWQTTFLLLALLCLGMATLASLHGAVLTEIRRRDDARFQSNRDSQP